MSLCTYMCYYGTPSSSYVITQTLRKFALRDSGKIFLIQHSTTIRIPSLGPNELNIATATYYSELHKNLQTSSGNSASPNSQLLPCARNIQMFSCDLRRDLKLLKLNLSQISHTPSWHLYISCTYRILPLRH